MSYELDKLTQDESALKDAGDGEGDEESEEDEHDVVDGEGADEAGDGLDHARYQHRRPAPESASRKVRYTLGTRLRNLVFCASTGKLIITATYLSDAHPKTMHPTNTPPM